MQKFVAASMLVSVIAAVGFCADDVVVVQTQSGSGIISAQQGTTQKVNTMVDTSKTVTATTDKTATATTDKTATATTEKSGTTSNEKAVAEWTNPAGKVIKNHDMAKKLENQAKKEASNKTGTDATKAATTGTAAAKTVTAATDAGETVTDIGIATAREAEKTAIDKAASVNEFKPQNANSNK